MEVFSAVRHVPALAAACSEIAPCDAQFVKWRQQYLEADIRDRELETILDCIKAKDEITATKNILIEIDEAESIKAFELERSQKLRQATKEIATNITQACSRNVQVIQQLEELRSNPDAELEKQRMMAEWCDRVIKCRDELAGVAVESIAEGQLVLVLVPRAAENTNKYHLTIRFHPTTAALLSLELSPPDVPVEDLLYVTENVRSIHTLIAELHNRLHSHLRLKSEISQLAQRFRIEKAGEREIMVTFSNGTKCHLHIGHDYPRPYATIRIMRVEGHLPPALSARLQDEKNRRIQGMTIKKLLKTIARSLESESMVA